MNNYVLLKWIACKTNELQKMCSIETDDAKVKSQHPLNRIVKKRSEKNVCRCMFCTRKLVYCASICSWLKLNGCERTYPTEKFFFDGCVLGVAHTTLLAVHNDDVQVNVKRVDVSSLLDFFSHSLLFVFHTFTVSFGLLGFFLLFCCCCFFRTFVVVVA